MLHSTHTLVLLGTSY